MMTGVYGSGDRAILRGVGERRVKRKISCRTSGDPDMSVREGVV